MTDKRQLILHDNLWRLMVRLSVPGIAGMLVIAVNSFVDALYVGRFLGAAALAGVSMTIPLMVVNTALLNLVAAGANSLLSRSIGRDDKDIQERIFAHVLLLCVAVSILLMIPGFFFATPFVALTGATGEVLQYGAQYYATLQMGCFFSVFGLVSSGLVRAEGQVKRAMLISMAGVGLNALLNPLFIFVCGMGVSGSAIATIVSMCCYCLLTTHYFLSGKSSVRIRMDRDSWRSTIFRDILVVGFSAMIMQLSSFMRQLFLFKAVTRYGSETQVILFSAIYRLFSFSIIPVFGMLQVLQPVVGINYGAGLYKRSTDALLVFGAGCTGLMALVALPSFLFPQQVLGLLISGTIPDASGIAYFRLVLAVLLVAPLSSVAVVYLQATGHTRWLAWLTGGREIILFLPLVLLLPDLFGYAGVYYALVTENVLYTVIVLLLLRYYMVHVPVLDGAADRFSRPVGFFQLFYRKAGK